MILACFTRQALATGNRVVRVTQMMCCLTAIDQHAGRKVLTMADLTYMDCWHFIAPLIPVGTETSQEIYVMVFQALKEADERRKKNG